METEAPGSMFRVTWNFNAQCYNSQLSVLKELPADPLLLDQLSGLSHQGIVSIFSCQFSVHWRNIKKLLHKNTHCT